MLFHAGLLVQQTDFETEEQSTDAIRTLEEITSLFRLWSRAQNEQLLSMLSFDVANDFINEHTAIEKISHDLHNYMLTRDYATTKELCRKAGLNISRVLNEYIAYNLRHMNREETILNEILLQEYSDEDLKHLSDLTLNSFPSEKKREYSKWLFRGLNDTELLLWLREVRSEMPQLYQEFCELAQQELPTTRWRLLSWNLSASEVAVL